MLILLRRGQRGRRERRKRIGYWSRRSVSCIAGNDVRDETSMMCVTRREKRRVMERVPEAQDRRSLIVDMKVEVWMMPCLSLARGRKGRSNA